MIPLPKEFKVRLSIEDSCLRVDFEEGGECRAIVSERLTGDFIRDQAATNNLRDSVVQVMMERFYPDLCLPWKSLHAGQVGMQQVYVDTPSLEERKTRHRFNFGTAEQAA